MEVEQPDWLVQMEGILESLNEGVLITDECQAIVFANSNLEEFAIWPSSQLKAHSVSAVAAELPLVRPLS